MKELWYTVGPSSLGKETELLQNGATGVRLTFSYGTAELQEERAVGIKKAAAQLGRPCLIVADLAGEKLRLGSFGGEPSVPVTQGMLVNLIHSETTVPSRDDLELPVPDVAFFSNVKEGNVVTVGDGGATLIVTRVFDDKVLTEATADGVIDQCRGLSVQGAEFQPCSLTPKDLQDLKHILSSSAYDAVALSFVGSGDDVLRTKQMVQKANRTLPIIAKIETLSGVQNITQICRLADYVMAARGDLALSVPWLELPAMIEKIASAAIATSTPWILATQIAEGLERFSIPTRAEICDLAHWLRQGCSGCLLSYETAFGAHPLDAVTCTALLLKRWGDYEK